jgi:hypothetical protein
VPKPEFGDFVSSPLGNFLSRLKKVSQAPLSSPSSCALSVAGGGGTALWHLTQQQSIVVQRLCSSCLTRPATAATMTAVAVDSSTIPNGVSISWLWRLLSWSMEIKTRNGHRL